MDQQSIFGILSLGFTLGLFHALDADHIMAVSLLASKNRRLKNKAAIIATTLRYCLKWAIGHGGILLLIGLVLILTDYQLPVVVSQIAEKAVGLFLIALGFWITWQVITQKIHLHLHDHNGISHIHLAKEKHNQHSHQPVLVGTVHGLAGSAPVLALIPTLGTNSGWIGLAYLLLFSAGVLFSMILFGLFFSQLQGWISKFGHRTYQVSRLMIGIASIAFGSYWLVV